VQGLVAAAVWTYVAVAAEGGLGSEGVLAAVSSLAAALAVVWSKLAVSCRAGFCGSCCAQGGGGRGSCCGGFLAAALGVCWQLVWGSGWVAAAVGVHCQLVWGM
jgi:hypothetical protein